MPVGWNIDTQDWQYTSSAILNEVQAIFPNFKDVPALLAKYKELNSNRNLQIFLIGAASDFVTLCRKIVLTFFPKAKDWPPPERQPTITSEDMVKPEPKKVPPPKNK